MASTPMPYRRIILSSFSVKGDGPEGRATLSITE
jgi:hypothetical protein